MIDKKDAEFLLAREEFKRFLYAVIQTSGLLGDTGVADGRTARDFDLSFNEGRRSLGREILLMAEQGQPDQLYMLQGQPLATLHAVLLDAINPKEKPNGRRTNHDRYDDLDDRSAGHDDD